MLLIRVENRYQGGVFTGCANGVRIAGEQAPWRGTADIARSLVRRRDAPASASAGVCPVRTCPSASAITTATASDFSLLDITYSVPNHAGFAQSTPIILNNRLDLHGLGSWQITTGNASDELFNLVILENLGNYRP